MREILLVLVALYALALVCYACLTFCLIVFFWSAGRKVRPIFATYDLWMGIYWNRQDRKLYLFPIPTMGAVVTLEKQSNIPRNVGEVSSDDEDISFFCK